MPINFSEAKQSREISASRMTYRSGKIRFLIYHQEDPAIIITNKTSCTFFIFRCLPLYCILHGLSCCRHLYSSSRFILYTIALCLYERLLRCISHGHLELIPEFCCNNKQISLNSPFPVLYLGIIGSHFTLIVMEIAATVSILTAVWF